MLTALGVVAEVFVLHVQVKREAQTLALSEIPLVLGLAFAAPGALVAGFVTGGALAYVFHRHQRGLKLAYNLALKATDGILAVTLYTLVLGATVPPTPSAGSGSWPSTSRLPPRPCSTQRRPSS